jgi:hypothetical protein
MVRTPAFCTAASAPVAPLADPDSGVEVPAEQPLSRSAAAAMMDTEIVVSFMPS